tara:strand:+ start:32 stop:499 length:468 start_codon:yes stop_codon:yes gene_type:complete
MSKLNKKILRILEAVAFSVFFIVYAWQYSANVDDSDIAKKIIWGAAILVSFFGVYSIFKPQEYHDDIQQKQLEKLNRWKSSKKINTFIILWLLFMSFAFFMSNKPIFISGPLLLYSLAFSLYFLRQIITGNDVNVNIYRYIFLVPTLFYLLSIII